MRCRRARTHSRPIGRTQRVGGGLQGYAEPILGSNPITGSTALDLFEESANDASAEHRAEP